MDPSTATRACELFAALAHPMRLRIVETLCIGERSVGHLADEIGLGQSGTSQHLAILVRAGVLTSESRGTSRIYRVRGPRIATILQVIAEFCHVHRLYGSSEQAELPRP